MPKVNRIRVSNIKIDKGDKVFGDKELKLYGNNSLFILENGGGKTSLIQLLLQVVLPNEKLQDRSLKDSVLKDNSIHVAVEWTPDDENYNKFITGFSFHNYGGKLDNRESYTYFNFIIETDYSDAPSLEEIEFVRNGKVTRTTDLEKILKKRKGVQVFGSNTEYQSALKQYGILVSEWKNIAKVNNIEGGVNAFFEKAKTTDKLVERLFIPSLLESLFETEEERNAIANAFKKYKDSLMELPKLEKDLNDFKVITNHSDKVIDACQAYNTVLTNLKESRRTLARLYKTILFNSKTNKNWLEKANEELKELEDNEKELRWKIESFEAFKKQMHIDNLESEISGLNEELTSLQNEKERIERSIKEQNAARLYEDYQIHNNNAVDAQTKLDVVSLKSGDKAKELNRARKRVSEGYRFLLNRNKEEQEALSSQLKETSGHLKDAKKKLKETTAQKGTLERQQAENNLIIKQYDQDLNELKRNLTSYWEVNIDKTEENISKAIGSETDKAIELENQWNQTEAKIDKNKKFLFQTGEEIRETRKTLEQTEKDFEEFSDTESKLKNKVMANLSILVQKDLFEDRERMADELQKCRKENHLELIKKSIESAHLEQIVNSISQRGYHVNPELEGVKDFLIRKGIDVVLGTDLLNKLNLDENKKRLLIKKNPLLTFSIAIEFSQLTQIKRALEGYKKDLTIPILFVERTKLDDQEERESIFFLDGTIQIFHRFKVRLSESEWLDYSEELNSELDGYRQSIAELNDKINDLHQLDDSLKRFWEKYSSVSRISYTQRINDLNSKLVDLIETEDTLSDLLQKLSGEKESLKNQIKQHGILLNQLDNFRSLIKTFQTRYAAIDNVRNLAKKLQEDIGGLTQILRETNKSIETFEDLETNLSRALESLSHRVNHLKRDSSEYSYDDTPIEMEVTVDEYGSIRSAYNALRKEMSFELEVVENLKSSLKNYKETALKVESEIKKYGFSIEGLSKMNLIFNQGILENLELDLQDTLNDLSEIVETKDTKEKKVIGLKGGLENLLSSIQKTHKQEHFEYGSDAEEEKELYQESLERALSDKQQLVINIDRVEAKQKENKFALDDLEASKELMLDEYSVDILGDAEWNKEKPFTQVRKIKDGIDRGKEQLKDKQFRTKKVIDFLMAEVEKTKNHTIISMSRDLIRVLDSTKDDYEQIISAFVTLLESIKKFEDAIEVEKRQKESGRDLLIKMMYERSELLHKNILDIQKSTQVIQNGEVFSYFRFSWPKKEDEDINRQLREFVNDMLRNLTNLRNQGATDEQINNEFEKKADMLNILNCYADINRCKIEALKPRNELLIGKKDWEPWDKTKDWSIGEQHATRMAMFIGFNNHLRKARYSKENSWKFLLVDNPFGAANADHVVRPMIELAKKTKTQLFCFTGLNDKRIQEDFETVIHNTYIYQRGILFLNSVIDYKIEEQRDAARLDSIFYAK